MTDEKKFKSLGNGLFESGIGHSMISLPITEVVMSHLVIAAHCIGWDKLSALANHKDAVHTPEVSLQILGSQAAMAALNYYKSVNDSYLDKNHPDLNKLIDNLMTNVQQMNNKGTVQ